MSPDLNNIIYEKSILVAKHLGGSIIYPRDLMLCILFEGGSMTNDLLQKSWVDKDKICSVLQKIQVEVKSVTQAEKTNKIGKATNWILVKSNKLVEDLEDEEIEIMHVIWCFLSYVGKNEFIVPVKNALFSEGLTEKKFKIYFLLVTSCACHNANRCGSVFLSVAKTDSFIKFISLSFSTSSFVFIFLILVTNYLPFSIG